jgi:hypothetical protein
MVSGAVVIVAGAILVGSGMITVAIAHASNHFSPGGEFTTWAGAFVGVIGLVVLATGFRSDSAPRP